MEPRPLTIVTYDLELITSEGEVTETLEISYDSEMYDEDRDGADMMFINLKMTEMKEKYGDDVFLLGYSIGREQQGGLH
ncbi:hypothetical protein [Peribacillus asahii]|uniref:hypothetical protein n=1 Tax=Peribacillus asahii TaxID=228899 RepID=UPI00381091D7